MLLIWLQITLNGNASALLLYHCIHRRNLRVWYYKSSHAIHLYFIQNVTSPLAIYVQQMKQICVLYILFFVPHWNISKKTSFYQIAITKFSIGIFYSRSLKLNKILPGNLSKIISIVLYVSKKSRCDLKRNCLNKDWVQYVTPFTYLLYSNNCFATIMASLD